MHFIYLNLISDINSHDPETLIKSSHLPHPLFIELSKNPKISLRIVQRATFNASKNFENVTYNFLKDEFDPTLLWWQEPITVIEHISKLKPDVILVRGLNLPLQFRWLRREVGKKIIIIGEHTGEPFWASRNLWLQQFGLRVVDGFIFQDLKKAHSWTKASVILDKQPIVKLLLSSKDTKATRKSLINFYETLLTTRDTKSTKI